MVAGWLRVRSVLFLYYLSFLYPSFCTSITINDLSSFFANSFFLYNKILVS